MELSKIPAIVISGIGQYVTPISSYIYKNITSQHQQLQGENHASENSTTNADDANFLWKIETVIDEWKETESKGLSVCVVGRVSTGKSSLVSALFAPDPRDNVPDHPLNGKIKVGAEGGTTQKPCAILVDLGTPEGKLLIIDLPGLHDTPDRPPNNSSTNSSQAKILPNISSLFKILKKKKIDLGIFVIDGIPTDTSVEDFSRLNEISNKVFLVFNKIDTLDYLKPEKRAEVVETTRLKMGATKIFPTVCKGYDPEADREHPNWYDVRGVDELQEAITEYVIEHKDRELSEKMRSREFWKNFQNITIRTAISVGVLAMVLVRASK